MFAGRAIVIAWHGAVGDALQRGDEERVFRLFEAALSVPIRMRLARCGRMPCGIVGFFS